MKIHTPMTEGAQRALYVQKRNSLLAAFLIGLLIMFLIALGLQLYKLYTFRDQQSPMVLFQEELINEEPLVKEKVKRSLLKKPPAPTSQPSKVVTAATVSDFSIPIPELNVESPLEIPELGTSLGFGAGFGNEFAYASTFSGAFTIFGRQGGNGLVGSFYDYKQDRDGNVTDLGRFYEQNSGGSRIAVHRRHMEEHLRAEFSDESLKDLFKAETNLSFTHLVMEQTQAAAAPEAFEVENEVKPSGWVVVYEGKVAAPEAGLYRFVGRFDDIMLVYVNGRLVFDGSYHPYTEAFDRDSTVEGPSMINIPMMHSKWVRFSGEDDIKIVIGETPGGLVGGGLFIERKGEDYKKNAAGEAILPPFATEPLTAEQKQNLSNMSYPIEVEDVPIFERIMDQL